MRVVMRYLGIDSERPFRWGAEAGATLFFLNGRKWFLSCCVLLLGVTYVFILIFGAFILIFGCFAI